MMNNLPFVNRQPTHREIEQFRLILSTYQDGTGMLANENRTLPGWRDFERAVAITFKGNALESKWIYDVLLPKEPNQSVYYGLSCKMRNTLRTVEKRGRVTIEVSNASGEFWDAIKANGLTQENYHINPQLAGKTLIEVVEIWHQSVGIENEGIVDNDHSFYIILQWDRLSGRYQMFQFPIDLPDPDILRWEVNGRRLIAWDRKGILFEWYGLSGGQLKYYPLAENALWSSPIFYLEPLPKDLEHSLKYKAATYFPDLWQKTEKQKDKQ